MQIVNHSNHIPIADKLVVFIDGVQPPKTGGGIFIPLSERSKQAYEATTGIVLAMGKRAFEKEDPAERPKVGDRVTFNSYCGVLIEEPMVLTEEQKKEYHGDVVKLYYRGLRDHEIHNIYKR